MASHRQGRGWIVAASVVAIAFGLLTLREGGGVLFGGEPARRAVGHYVPFVLWFNFLAGFAYVAAGAGLWAHRRWGAVLAYLVAAATIVVFLAFGVHVARGGAYELRTVIAMSGRTVVWLLISAAAYRWVWAVGETPDHDAAQAG